jgi:PhnB protein
MPVAPAGWHSVTPRLVASDARGLVRFVKRVFGATGDHRRDRPTVVTIGDSPVMVSEAGPRPATSGFLYVYVVDADATCSRAVQAGAKVIEEPYDTPYGDRRGMVEDPWGNVWQIATHTRRLVASDEGGRRKGRAARGR